MEITYFSDAQLPKSMIRQRSLQKGMNSLSGETTFRQIGHRIDLTNHYERATSSGPCLQAGRTDKLAR